MENTEQKKKSSRPLALLLLIPALLFGIISLALAVVGLGLIPIIPALIGIILAVVSFFLFRDSFRVFTKIVIGISLIAVVVSIIRGVILEKKVAADEMFDNTLIKTQEGIDSDLNDAFGDDVFGPSGNQDTIK